VRRGLGGGQEGVRRGSGGGQEGVSGVRRVPASAHSLNPLKQIGVRLSEKYAKVG
jgi:hypothetical protein